MLPIIDITSPAAPREIDQGMPGVRLLRDPNHGVSDELRNGVARRGDRLLRSKRRREGGRCRSPMVASAWRGWFPLGGELTSGVPDLKEGYYFGRELPADPRPMHGPNIWPDQPASLQPLVTEWMATMEPLAQRVLSLMAEGLGLSSRLLPQRPDRRPDAAVSDLPLSPSSTRQPTTAGASPSTATTAS